MLSGFRENCLFLSMMFKFDSVIEKQDIYSSCECEFYEFRWVFPAIDSAILSFNGNGFMLITDCCLFLGS